MVDAARAAFNNIRRAHPEITSAEELAKRKDLIAEYEARLEDAENRNDDHRFVTPASSRSCRHTST